MKGMKKLLSILMVLTLVLSLGATAFAANIKVVAPGPENDEIKNHSYKAYQIFSGTQSDDSGNKLGDVKWGSDITEENGAALIEALKTDERFIKDGVNVFADCTDAADVAEALGNFETDSTAAKAFAAVVEDYITETGGVKLEAGEGKDVDDGYYLIVDTTNVGDKQSAKNSSMLQVTRDIEIRVKYDVPTVDKKVKDINDTDGSLGDWKMSADWDIGDHVPFQLTGTVQNEGYDLYETYKTVLHDKQSPGLTLLPNTMKISFDGGETYYQYNGTNFVKDGAVATGVSLVYSADSAQTDGCTFEIVIEDTKTLGVKAGGTIIAEYDSELNENAVIGSTGNPNEVTLEFSNDYNNKGTGHTPPVTVIVFTFKADVDKTDGENPLPGAGFVLMKKYSQANLPTEYKNGTYPEYSYEALKEASETEGGLPKMFADPDGVNFWLALEVTEVKAGTTFSFKGIDDGTYKLVETKVPDGYNKAEDIEFTVTIKHDLETGTSEAFTSLTTDKENVTVIEEAGVKTGVKTEVENHEGATLPETGGIGTTIFYIAGAVLVAGAVILLVTKKRVSGMEK